MFKSQILIKTYEFRTITSKSLLVAKLFHSKFAVRINLKDILKETNADLKRNPCVTKYMGKVFLSLKIYSKRKFCSGPEPLDTVIYNNLSLINLVLRYSSMTQNIKTDQMILNSWLIKNSLINCSTHWNISQ